MQLLHVQPGDAAFPRVKRTGRNGTIFQYSLVKIENENTPALESGGSLSEAASLAEMVERMVVEQAVRLLLTMMLMQAA